MTSDFCKSIELIILIWSLEVSPNFKLLLDLVCKNVHAHILHFCHEPIGQGCQVPVLLIHHPACFPSVPALLCADYLDQMCPVNQKEKKPESANLQEADQRKLENSQGGAALPLGLHSEELLMAQSCTRTGVADSLIVWDLEGCREVHVYMFQVYH